MRRGGALARRTSPTAAFEMAKCFCLSVKRGGGSVRRQLALDLMIDDKPFYRHKHQCTHTSSDGHSMKRVTRTLSKRVTRTLSKRATRTRVEAEAEEEEEEEEEGSDPIGFRGLTQLGYVQT